MVFSIVFVKCIVCAEDAENLVGSFHYNTSLFTPETISRFAEHYLQLLKSVVINPDATLSVLSILSSHERNYVFLLIIISFIQDFKYS